MTVLPPLPPDPEPTEDEIAEDLAHARATWTGADDYFLRLIAAGFWRATQRKHRPDEFKVPFVDNPAAYNRYRRSEKWKGIRARVLDAANHECSGCGAKATQVHHRDYRPRVLEGKDVTPLVALCKSCHNYVHNDGDKRRDTWEEQERALARLISTRRRATKPTP